MGGAPAPPPHSPGPRRNAPSPPPVGRGRIRGLSAAARISPSELNDERKYGAQRRRTRPCAGRVRRSRPAGRSPDRDHGRGLRGGGADTTGRHHRGRPLHLADQRHRLVDGRRRRRRLRGRHLLHPAAPHRGPRHERTARGELRRVRRGDRGAHRLLAVLHHLLGDRDRTGPRPLPGRRNPVRGRPVRRGQWCRREQHRGDRHRDLHRQQLLQDRGLGDRAGARRHRRHGLSGGRLHHGRRADQEPLRRRHDRSLTAALHGQRRRGRTGRRGDSGRAERAARRGLLPDQRHEHPRPGRRRRHHRTAHQVLPGVHPQQLHGPGHHHGRSRLLHGQRGHRRRCVRRTHRAEPQRLRAALAGHLPRRDPGRAGALRGAVQRQPRPRLRQHGRVPGPAAQAPAGPVGRRPEAAAVVPGHQRRDRGAGRAAG
ncbi:hypothetical protein SFIMM107S_00969 [Streptomyces griseus]